MINPFMDMFAAYMKERGALEVILLMQNEQDYTEAMLSMIEGYPFRTLLFNVANNETDFILSMQNIRPTPNYYAIFSTASGMNGIFETVCYNFQCGKFYKFFPSFRFTMAVCFCVPLSGIFCFWMPMKISLNTSSKWREPQNLRTVPKVFANHCN